MYNYLFRIAYCGSNYKGFQVQKNGLAVAEVFQNAVEIVFGQRCDIKGCSRTDSGVHARDFCISMKSEKLIPCEGVVRGLNINLPSDVAVKSCEMVEEDFHARYNSLGKRYVYAVHNSHVKDPFNYGKVMEFRYHIDEEIANKAAQDFVGYHDFKAFCRAGSTIEDFRRTIYSAKVHREGDMVYFTVEGDGFLYNMVRIMAGTLIDITQGKLKADSIPSIIESRERTRAGVTAPPEGLYLDYVYYEDAPWLGKNS